MDIDFRKRCMTETQIDGMTCRIIRYGVSATEMNKGLQAKWYEMPSMEDFDNGGRKPEYKEPIQEKVQGYRDTFSFGTRYQISGTKSLRGIKTGTQSFRGYHRFYKGGRY